ncbi:outer membrane lipoprotein LolB [Amphritea atlantica]|uniref:Outer-membrane lipoprotein LolB n=1 Tax=Amphritea atlantica TaxID=355243 RepID=A0A1H9JQP6_9GAMM|nr:lipoprotein insertase outer membrane protein LolB [Amphritea atlantica]SEQ89291.1 outer membrane lipoprotein LolB [Amphritea atlantica]
MRLRLLILAAVLLLSGCTGLTPKDQVAPTERPWEEQYPALLAADSWQLKGKIAIRTARENNNASLFWQQLQQHYQIELTGPLGQGGARIEGDDDGITIDIAGEEPLWAATPEQLMEQTLGWQFPVRDLPYWIRGVPAPGHPFELSMKQQHLQKLQQNNWEINYLRFTNQNGYMLPEKLTISRNDLRLTIIAKEWQIQL